MVAYGGFWRACGVVLDHRWNDHSPQLVAMAHLYRPGMKMYQVIWERDGERMYEHIEHAADEADACSRAEASVAELGESQKFNVDRTGITVRVRVITSALELNDDF
jgi:hypothetical protein